MLLINAYAHVTLVLPPLEHTNHVCPQGYLLGNPSTDHLYDGYGEAFMWFSHNLISDATYAGLKRYCGYAHIAREIEGAQDGYVHSFPHDERVIVAIYDRSSTAFDLAKRYKSFFFCRPPLFTKHEHPPPVCARRELDNLYNTQRRRSVRLDNNGQFVEEGDEDDDEEKVELYKSQCSMFNGKAHEEVCFMSGFGEHHGLRNAVCVI